MVSLAFYGCSSPFMEFSVNGKKYKNTCYEFFAIVLFALPQSSFFNFYVHFRTFCLTLFTHMLSLYRHEKVTCENCGTQTTRLNLERQKRSCSAGTLYCTQCPNFSTISQNDLNYHIAKKHSAPKPVVTFKCKFCCQEFPGFYALRQHKNTQHGTQFRFGASNIAVEDIVGDVDDQSLREELESCKHFSTDTEMENGRHRFFNFAMSSFDKSLLNDKLDYVFKELNCAAKVNLAFGFVLKNFEDGMCRYFCTHENNTGMERSYFVRT